ncbi:Shikimate 5-dehydrogenase [uncultured Defluviicoccus sp.]|uniref:Shikimate 5-dehydrogenase n=1 Tax=metagenome TaxID=256318 RepID=A0A380TDK9_9ZZZZ|nr:Shikimate 5-dehydrogenase [uncultured Defluviicoccus sp.]
MIHYPPATQPTMYFIGVTTAKSSINKVFPLWARQLGLRDCVLRGIDFKLHDEPARYRAAVDFIKHDPLSRGALVTTHKMDLCAACHDQFDELEPLSAAMGEVSSIYKRGPRLHGRAADPWTVGYSLEAFLPAHHWRTGAEAFILGAGGSAIALAWHLTKPEHGTNRPARVHVANRSTPRLDHLRELHAGWKTGVPLDCHHVSTPELADRVVAQLPPGSLVVNATGLGKDAPGSPLTNAVVFPERGLVWEFNYRGDLLFLQQARAQEKARRLHVEDGWVYFIHGWTRVMSDVFDVEIPTRGPAFDELGRLAASTR